MFLILLVWGAVYVDFINTELIGFVVDELDKKWL